MISIRKSNDRGKSKIEWLESYHTFSFADYYDPDFMGYSVLRVINQDTVQPGFGFDRHPHNNMEIISYVISGELEHKDNMGTGSVIKPHEIQRMSAGSGVEHSEFNHSKKNPLHFLQIWIKPDTLNIKPSYEQKAIPDLKNQLILIGSDKPSESAIKIHQDVKLYVAYMDADKTIQHPILAKRSVWIQIITGKLEINKQAAQSGDGILVTDEKSIQLHALENNTEFLLFDLPAPPQ